MSLQLSGDSGVTYTDGSNQPYASSPYGIKNKLINGEFRIDQRNAGASLTPTTDGQYTLDRFQVYISQASKFSVQQNAGSVTPPAGFNYYAGITSLSAYTVGSSDYFCFVQNVEGYNIGDFAWGTASAKTVMLSFWVRSSLTGTFGGSIRNGAANYSFPFNYTISSANTWEQKTVTITAPTSGTWTTTNTSGLQVIFGLGVGSTNSGTANAWTGSSVLSATSAVSVVGTNGATWYVTGAQLEIGSTATPFERRLYGTELALCQRYYQRLQPGLSSSGLFSGVAYSTGLALLPIIFPVVLRSAPTLSYSANGDFFLVGNSNTYTPTNIALTSATATNTRLDVSTSGLTGGNGIILQIANNPSTTYIAFSSEL